MHRRSLYRIVLAGCVCVCWHLFFGYVFYRSGAPFDQANPPCGRVERAVVVVKRRVDIVEVVPNCCELDEV